MLPPILGFGVLVIGMFNVLSRFLVPGLCAVVWLLPSPVAAGEVIPVTERERIEASLDQEITVEGRIERIGESKTRAILFLNFEGLDRGGFTLIIRQGTLAGDYVQHDPAFAPSFVGKNVRVTGTVTTYKGGFQMQVFAPSQIEVLGEADSYSWLLPQIHRTSNHYPCVLGKLGEVIAQPCV